MTQPTPCPHCPDGHTPPTSGSQSWAVWVTELGEEGAREVHGLVGGGWLLVVVRVVRV